MESPTEILLTDDDANLGYLLKENLDAKGFNVHWSKDGKEAMGAFGSKKFELCILDIMLPRVDGFTLARHIRNIDSQIPIIFLTARSNESDRCTGFDAGCDDYVIKPFSGKELLLRIRAILRRTNHQQQNCSKEVFKIGDYTFNYTNRELIWQDQVTKLSSKETELLKILGSNPNQMMSRSSILNAVWNSDDYFVSKSMDVYLTKIRKMLKSDPRVEIQNIHGMGYRLLVLQE